MVYKRGKKCYNIDEKLLQKLWKKYVNASPPLLIKWLAFVPKLKYRKWTLRLFNLNLKAILSGAKNPASTKRGEVGQLPNMS